MIAIALTLLAGCGAGTTDSAGAETAGLQVAGIGLSAVSGPVRGPFTPDSGTYQVVNIGSAGMNWLVSTDQPWVTVTPSSGSLAPLTAEPITVSINQAADDLPSGSHAATLSFVNTTDGVGDTTRSVTLTVTALGSQPMTTALRTSGVAPLAVTFDAVGSVSGVAQPGGTDPDHGSFTYIWDFGDPDSGTWPYTTKSKNKCTGWLASHVYETPGTFRATLKIIDQNGTEFDYHQDITVTDPASVFASRTYHVAANGNDSQPGTQASPFATIGRALQTLQGATSPTRIRLRRGDSFSHGSGISINTTAAPVLIDSYGSGALPVLDFPSANVGFTMAGSDDARIVGLRLTCSSTTRPSWARGVALGRNSLVHECIIENFGYAASTSGSPRTTLSECELLDSQEYGCYLEGSPNDGSLHHAIIGCRFDEAGFHLLRTYTDRSIIAHSLFQRAGFSAIKMGGRPLPNPNRFNTVVDNVFETVTPDLVGVGPENAQSTNQIALDHLFEANHFRPADSTSTAGACLRVMAGKVTVRNNIFEVHGRWPAHVSPAWGVGPMPHHVTIENNTAYAAQGNNLTFCLVTSSDATIVRGNIAYCAQGSASISGTVAASGNLLTDPMFVSAATRNFRPAPNSPARVNAPTTGARTDFYFARRGATPTSGAID